MAAEEVGPLQYASFGVAVLALALSVAALTWQFVLHTLTGARAKVELREGLYGSGGVVTIKAGKLPDAASLQSLASNGYRTHVYSVCVRSIGRMPVTVEDIRLRSSSGGSFQPVGELMGPKLPIRLEATGGVETWIIEAQAVDAAFEALAEVSSDDSYRVWAEVRLGDGRVKRGSGEITRVPHR